MKYVWQILVALIVAVVAFQLFFRYEFIHTIGVRVARVDRLTGAICTLPCDPDKEKVVYPTATPESEGDADARLIDFMRSFAGITHSPDEIHEWKIFGHYDEGATLEPAGADDGAYPIRVVCFCDHVNVGDFYEARPAGGSTFSVMEIVGNSVLERKYGITRTEPTDPAPLAGSTRGIVSRSDIVIQSTSAPILKALPSANAPVMSSSPHTFTPEFKSNDQVIVTPKPSQSGDEFDVTPSPGSSS